MVNTGTERGPFVQPDGNPVTKYTQAFDVGVGALIEPSAVNLIPANLVDWLGTGGLTVGSPVFTNETGFGEISCSASGSNDRSYARSSFSALAGDSVFSCKVIDCGLVPIQPRDLVSEVGVGSLLNYKINGSIVSESTPVLYQQGDILEAVYNFSSSSSTQFRIGLGTSTPNTADGMSIKLTQPQVEAGTQRSSFIQPNGAPAPRDASTPTVPNGNLPNSETVVYDEYINLSTFDIPTLLWAYADTRTQASIGVIDSGNGLGDTLQLVRIDGTGTTLTPLSVTMTQGISRNDRVLTKAYLKSDLFTFVVENQTTGETQSASDASIAGTIGGLGPIALGDAGTVASTFSRKIVDFEITAYTTP
jgi:hypothetical protein